mgnify:CR=1 FL=1
MPMIWTEPEVAFQIRVQYTRTEIEDHCKRAPDNDLRDFYDQGGLTYDVYHVYKDQSIYNKLQYWYTIDRHEDCEFEFDIRLLANHPIGHAEALQQAVDSGRFYFDGYTLSTRCVDLARAHRQECETTRKWLAAQRTGDDSLTLSEYRKEQREILGMVLRSNAHPLK